MDRMLLKNIGLLIIAALLTSSCYTELQTVERHVVVKERAEKPVYSEKEKSEQEPVERIIEATDEESYLEGYEHGIEDGYQEGWTDAEAYYFKDYETAQFYRKHHAALGHRSSGITYIHNYYGFGYPAYAFTGFYSPYYFHSGFYYPVVYYPVSGYYFGYNYYRYPHYGRPFFAFGFHRPFFFGLFVHHGSFTSVKSGISRTQTVRTSGLASRGTTRDKRVRSDARSTNNTRGIRSGTVDRGDRTSVRNDATRTGRTGLIDRRTRVSSNEGRSTIRSRTSTIRNNVRSRISPRSEIRNRNSSNRGVLNRSARTSSSRGTLNRSSRSSSSRGTVTRSSRSSSSRATTRSSRSSGRNR
ncbi:MAG: hypothetical protein ACFCU6_12580 [Balneolaceae bacterium]